MTSDEATLEEPRTISKAAFETLVVLTFLVLTIGEMAIAVALSRALKSRFDKSTIGPALLFPTLILSRIAVDRVLRRFGLSRGGKTMERRGRTVAAPEGDVDDDEVVEVRFSRSFARFLFWGSLAVCVFLGVGLTLGPRQEPWVAVMGYILIAFFGLGLLNFLFDRKPQAWADRDGITGYTTGHQIRRRFVPWSEIASCEIETFYDTFGKPVLIRPILKGWNGEPLMPLYLLYTSMEDQERLVKYIKARLPKPKDDFWE